MTNSITVTNLLPLDSTRASSPQELPASQDVGDTSPEQQLEGEFGTLLAQMVLGAAVQAPLAVINGIGVLPEGTDAVQDSPENQTASVSDKSHPMPFAVPVPSLLQAQAKSAQGNEYTETIESVTNVFPLPSTEVAAGARGEQSDDVKTTNATSLPVNNVREHEGSNKEKIAFISSTEIVAEGQEQQSHEAKVVDGTRLPTSNARENGEVTKGKTTVVPQAEIMAKGQKEQSDDARVTDATRLPVNNARENGEVTKGKITAAPQTAIAAEGQKKQSDDAKITDATRLPVNNVRKDEAVNKGKTTSQGLSPILPGDHETKAQDFPEKKPDSVIKNLPLSSKENSVSQQNSVAGEAQFFQNHSQKISAGRTDESKVAEPVVDPNQETAVTPEIKKDFLKPAPAIVQTQIQSTSKVSKENQYGSETDAQGKESQNKSASGVQAAESSQSRDTVVKPVVTSQGGRGSYQQFAHMSSEHLMVKSPEQVSTEQPSPLTPELSKSIIDQITKELTFRMKDNVSEIRVLLKPESLGEVVVNMKMEESKITAQINVDQSTVKAAVELQLPQLRQALAERGIEIHRIDVLAADQSLARESRDQQSGKSKKRSSGGVTGIEEQDLNYSPRSLGYNTIELLI